MKFFYQSCLLAIFAVAFLIPATSFGQTNDPKVKEALRLLDLGNPRQAKTNLQQYIAKEPKIADARAAIALAELQLGDVDQAAKDAQFAFDLDRKSVLSRIARASVYGNQGKTSNALAEFDQALKLNDKEIGTYLALARYYMAIDSLKPAEINLYRAQGISDKDVRPYLGLAELYERQHIVDLAITQYESAKKLDPSDETVLAKLAGLYLRAKRYDESINQWIALTHLDSTYADAYYQIGNLFFLGGQWSNAAGYAQRYTQLKPDDIYGQWLLARSLVELNQYTQALPALEKVASNDSLRALSQLLLARSYVYSKDFPKAVQIYSTARNLGPVDYDYWGKALFLSGDTTGAIAKLRQSLAGDTVRTAQEKLQTEQQIGTFLYYQKDYAGAADVFAHIASQAPTVDMYNAAAQFYGMAGNTESALATYNKSLAIDSNSLKTYMAEGQFLASKQGSSDLTESVLLHAVKLAEGRGNDTLGLANAFLGYHYLAKKEFKPAITHLEKATKLLNTKSPSYSNFALMLAQAYHSAGDHKEAEVWYHKVLAFDPNNKGAKDGLDQLRKSAPKAN